MFGAALASALVLGGVIAAVPTAAQAAPLPPGCDDSGECSVELTYSGEVERWTVPAGAKQVAFEVVGGSGQSHWFAGGLGGAFTTAPADFAAGTEFAIAVGQGGQGIAGGWGGGGAGGALNDSTYQGQGGGGGSFVFFQPADAPWRAFAVAGGGAGAAGGGHASIGGGANAAGETGPNGANGGRTDGPGVFEPTHYAFVSPGASGTGPASYSASGGLVPGAGGVGGAAEGPGGSGSGAGGGYTGGAGGGGGITGSGYNGTSGGGGAGFLASGFGSEALTQSPLGAGESRNGHVTISYRLAAAVSTVSVPGSPYHATFGGGPVDLTAAVDCAYGAEGGTVTFSRNGTVLGTAPIDPATQRATLRYTPTAQGSYTTTASYSGRGGVCAPASTTFDFFVSVATGSFSKITASPRDVVLGNSTTLRATAACAAQPSGSIQFTRDGETLATVPVDATGTAEYRYTPTKTGTDHVQVYFLSDRGGCVVPTEDIVLTVTPKPKAPTTPPTTPGPTASGGPLLPKTGTTDAGAPMAGTALALLVLGAAALLLVRRGSRRGSAA